MNETMSYMQAMQIRSSCRTFDGTLLTKQEREAMERSLDPGNGPMGNRARFRLFAASEDDSRTLEGLGTYGFVRGMPAFLGGAIREAPFHLEDYGYLMEIVILNATRAGIQTCWLGGSFKRSSFSKRMELVEGEIIPAVTPLGHNAKRQRARDWLIRKSAGSEKRRPFGELFFRENWDEALDPESAGPYRMPLEMVRLAPSATNRQPWRVVYSEKDGPAFRFYMKRTPGYRAKGERFGTVDLQRVDMGIAMAHFELGCRESGAKGRWIREEPGTTILNGVKGGDITYLVTWKGE